MHCIKLVNIAGKIRDAFKHKQHLMWICVPESLSASSGSIAWFNLRCSV